MIWKGKTNSLFQLYHFKYTGIKVPNYLHSKLEYDKNAILSLIIKYVAQSV